MMEKDRNIDLTISGRKCRIHNNDNIARSLEKDTNLIEIGNSKTNTSSWKDDDDVSLGNRSSDDNKPPSPLLVDRYDARALLGDISLQQISDTHDIHNIDTGIYAASFKYTSQPFKEDVSQEEIEERNFIRYGSCSSYIKHTLKKKAAAEDNIAADGKESDTLDEAKVETTKLPEQEEEKEEEIFQLSEEDLKRLPKDILMGEGQRAPTRRGVRCMSELTICIKSKEDNMPKTMKHNNIIELTASRIATNNQLEVFLKVKQATNADFSFLNPSDDLHKYYLYLKEKHTPNKAKDEEDGSDASNTSGLAGLLGGYASSSSDSSCSPKKKNDTSSSPGGKKDTVTNAEQHTAVTTTDEYIKPSSSSSLSSEQDRKRKADRLERLRVWKESKLKERADDDQKR